MISREELFFRENEKVRIADYIDRAPKYQGKILFVSGENGIGKTILLENLFSQKNLTAFIGRGIEDYKKPYGIIASALRDARQKYRLNKNSENDFPEQIKYILPEFGKTDIELNPELLSTAIIESFKIINNDGLVILFLDDLQWADNSTLELLPILGELIANEKFALIGAYRDDELSRSHKLRRLRSELRRKRKLIEIKLGRFNKEETGVFLSSILNSSPSDKMIELIFHQTEGLPFFIEEICYSLIENDYLLSKGDKIDIPSVDKLIIPDSIKDLVLMKIGNMSSETREQLDLAAAAGVEFDLNLISSLSSKKDLDELLISNIVYEAEGNKGRFKHTLFREAVFSEILWSYKKKLNRLIAEYLEANNGSPEEISRHWLNANENEKARKYLLKASEVSCRIHAYNEAAVSASKALDIWPEGQDEDKRIDILINLAHCLKVSGNLNGAVAALKETLHGSLYDKDPSKYCEVLSELASLYGATGSNEQSLKLRIRSAEIHEKNNLHDEAANEWLAAAGKGTLLLRLEEAVRYCDKAIKISLVSKRADIQSRAMGLKGNIYSILGKTSEGIQIVNDGLKIALNNKMNEAASEVYRRLGSTLEYASKFQESKQVYTTAYKFCLKNGEENEAQICLSCMVYVLLRTGDWKECLKVCKEIEKDQKSAFASVIIAKIVSGVIHTFRGEYKTARKSLNRGYKEAINYNVHAIIPICLLGIALLAVNDGDHDAAENIFDEIKNYREKWNDTHDTVPGLMHAVNYYAEKKDPNKTSIYIDLLAQIASNNNNEENLAAFEYSLGEFALLTEKYDEAVSKFDASINHLNKLKLPSDLALVLFRNGMANKLNGNVEKAFENLSSAYSVSKKMGMRPMALQISRVLNDMGINPDSRHHKDYELNLTRRQMEILKLLPAGLSNKEISNRLFLSIRTVDMHVSNILKRLECRTRTEAVERAKENNLL